MAGQPWAQAPNPHYRQAILLDLADDAFVERFPNMRSPAAATTNACASLCGPPPNPPPPRLHAAPCVQTPRAGSCSRRRVFWLLMRTFTGCP